MKSVSTALFSVLFFSLAANAQFIDNDAVKRENAKKIAPVDDLALEREFREMEQARDEWENDNHQEYSWEGFQFLPETRRTELEKRAEKQRDQERERQLQESEIEILKKIKAYEEGSAYAAIIKNMRREWLEKWEDNPNSWPSDLALTIARYFDNLGEPTTAIHFYQLATLSIQVDANNIDYSCGKILLDEYNALVTRTRPSRPTAQLFALARIGAHYLDSGGYVCELGFALSSELKARRDMMVRWPVSPQRLIEDTYYPPNALLERIYAPGFVDKLLRDIGRLAKIFKAYGYNNASKDGDLLNALVKNHFFGIKRSYQGNPQYIWASNDGYLVRVKKSEDKTKWEFTVGLSYLNPFEWSGAKAAMALMLGDIAGVTRAPFFDDLHSNDELATAQFNEMFKVVVNEEDGEQLVMIAPAFRNFYWDGTGMRDQLLRQAHRTLNYVGKKTKKGPVLTKVDKHCGFGNH